LGTDWVRYKLSDIVDKSRGISYGIVQPGKHDNNGIPILKVNNLTNSEFEGSKLFKVSKTIEAKYARTRLHGGEILLSLVGSLGKVTYVKDNLVGNNVVRAIAVIPVVEEFSPQWVYWYLRSPIAKRLYENLATTSVQATLNLKEVKDIFIPFPPHKERDQLIAILSSLDDKIELNLEINKTLEEMAMAIYKEWFVDFGPFRDGEFVDSELGPIPKGWEVGKIGRISRIIGGYAFKGKDFGDDGELVIKIKNIKNGLVTLGDENRISNEIIMRADRKFKLLVGDYLVAMTGAEVGKIGVIPEYQKNLWLNQRVGVFRNNTIEIEGAIIAANFLSYNGNFEQIQNLAYGSAQPNISSSQIESIKIALPSNLSELKQFSDIISALHELRLNNYSENVTLEMTRDYLLPKLISGEVRVKAAEEKIKEVL